MVNDVEMKATDERSVCAAVCKARGGRYALHKDRARNLYKQSSGHNGSPAKHWLSHQPQLTTHKHKCSNTHTHTGIGRQSSKAMQTCKNIKHTHTYALTKWPCDSHLITLQQCEIEQKSSKSLSSKLNMEPHLSVWPSAEPSAKKNTRK